MKKINSARIPYKKNTGLKKYFSLNVVVFLSIFIFSLQPYELYSQQQFTQKNDIKNLSLIARTYDKESAFRFVKELTLDKYAGRSSGSDGCNEAGKWIADQFQSWGLCPFKNNSYFQTFNPPMAIGQTSNVIGYIPSIDKTSEVSIVIGAHYDHIGKDRSGNIFRGANDNASGTGSMMELAHTLAVSNLISHVNIVFIAFSAEEKGLIGSYYYANHPLFPIEKVIAMINLDMVGTGIGPWEVATNFDKDKTMNQLLTSALSYFKTSYRMASWYLRPVSDHYPFFEKGVPVLFFIRANPSSIGGYHTLKDTIDTIDPKNLEECGKVATLVILLLSKDLIYISPRYEFRIQSANSFDFFSIPYRNDAYI